MGDVKESSRVQPAAFHFAGPGSTVACPRLFQTPLQAILHRWDCLRPAKAVPGTFHRHKSHVDPGLLQRSVEPLALVEGHGAVAVAVHDEKRRRTLRDVGDGAGFRCIARSLNCLSANAMPVRRGWTAAGLPACVAVYGRYREMRCSLVPADQPSTFRKTAAFQRDHAAAPVVPQNASTVRGGQLPTPCAGGATERSGHCRSGTESYMARPRSLSQRRVLQTPIPNAK